MNSVDHSISRLRQAHGPALRMMVIAWFSASACLCVPGIVPFIPGMGGTACAAAPDFGKGFDLLFELGLQELPVDRWEYREIEGVGGRSLFMASPPEGLKDLVEAMGNTYTRGWVDKTTGDPRDPGNPEVIVLDGWQSCVSTQLVHSWGEPRRISLLAADERADAAALAKGLQGLVKSERGKIALLHSQEYALSTLFRAAQFHRRGYKAEANAAARALLSITPNPERVLDLAVQTLARAQYDQALARFSKNQDWQALEVELQRLLKTYPKAWPIRPLVQRLQALVQKRLASPHVPPLPHEESLSPEQRAWWSAVTGDSAVKKQPAEQLGYVTKLDDLGEQWLTSIKMAVPTAEFKNLQSELDSLPAWQRALFNQDRNWDWISVMAAALGDDTLVLQPVGFYAPYDFDTPLIGDAPELTGDELEDQWREFDRPQTRGDLARIFLKGVIPHGDTTGENLPDDPEELRALALEFAKHLQDGSPVAVAKYYLESGTREQKKNAMCALLLHGNDADMAPAKIHLLEKPTEHFEPLTILVKRQKAAAKPFLAEFRKSLTEELAQLGGFETTETLARYRTQLDALDTLAEGRNIRSVIEAYLQGKVAEGDLWQELRTYSVPGDSAILPDLGLEAVSRIPKDEGVRKWAMISSTLDFHSDLTPARREALRRIIQEDGEVPVPLGRQGTHPLAHCIYWMADIAENYGVSEFRQNVAQFDPADTWPIWIGRGKATLEGRAVPPVPAADQVPATRRQEILQAIPSRVDHGWPEYLATLSVAEKLALQEELRQHGVAPEWRPLALRITKIDTGSSDREAIAALREVVGKPLTGELAKSLAEICRTHNAKASDEIGHTLHIIPRPLLQGLQIQVEVYTLEDLKGPAHTALRAIEWLQKFKDQFGAPVGVQGCAWLRWPLNYRDNTLIHWHLDADRKWQNWATATYSGMGSAVHSGNVIPETSAATAFDERIRTWAPNDTTFWVEVSAFRTPPAAREAEDLKTKD